MKNTLLMAVALFIVTTTSRAQTMGTYTDLRDGEIYKTITIEDPLTGMNINWFADNLRYNCGGTACTYYEDNSNYHKNLGRLYQFKVASQSCPAGWRLPTAGEWKALVDYFGGTKSPALKSIKGWSNWEDKGNLLQGNGNNSSGFNVLPGGYRDYNRRDDIYSFEEIGEAALYWSSTIGGEHAIKKDDVEIVRFSNSGISFFWPIAPEVAFLYIRCVKTN